MVSKQNHFMNRFWSDVTSSSYDGAHDQLGAHMTIDHNMMMKNHHKRWWSIEWNHFYRWLGLCHCWGGEVTLFKAQIVSAFTRLVGCTIIIIIIHHHNHHYSSQTSYLSNILHQHIFKMLKIYPQNTRKSRHLKP